MCDVLFQISVTVEYQRTVVDDTKALIEKKLSFSDQKSEFWLKHSNYKLILIPNLKFLQ